MLKKQRVSQKSQGSLREEIEAVKKQTELITGKEAEKIAREIPENNLDEGYVL